MPSPVGHTLGGIAAGWTAVPARARWEHAGRAALIVGGLGALPISICCSNDHRGPSHSVGAALHCRPRRPGRHPQRSVERRGHARLGIAHPPRLAGERYLSPDRHHGSLAVLTWLLPVIPAPVSRGIEKLLAGGFLDLQHQSGGRGALPGRSRGRSGHGRDEVSSRAVVTLPRFLASDLDPIADRPRSPPTRRIT